MVELENSPLLNEGDDDPVDEKVGENANVLQNERIVNSKFNIFRWFETENLVPDL